MTIKIPQQIVTEMIEHSKSLAPIEACGYLAGKDQAVTKRFEMTNIDNSPEHFTFDPKEQFQAVKQARQDGLELNCVYHSHPASPARLSQEDIRLFNDPKMIYIIVSLHDGLEDVKAFMVNKPDDQTVEIKKVEIEVSQEDTMLKFYETAPTLIEEQDQFEKDIQGFKIGRAHV